MIVAPPEKEITLPSEDVESLSLTSQQLEKLKKDLPSINSPDVSVIGRRQLSNQPVTRRTDTSNDFSIVVGETESEFVFNFKEENLKIVPVTMMW